MPRQKDHQTPGVQPRRDRYVNRVEAQQALTSRRWQGGPPPTTELLARAIEQWQQLPGAVVSVPVSDLTSAQTDTTPDETDGSELTLTSDEWNEE